MKAVLPVLFSCFALVASGQTDSQKKEWLVGKWQFETFVTSAHPSRQELDSLTFYNKKNKGLVFTFTKDGKATTFLPTAPARENFAGVYRYYPSRKNLVLERNTGEASGFVVIQLSATVLQIGMKESAWQMKLRKLR